MISRAAYWGLLDLPEYRALVTQKAIDLKSDGCTGVPDFYLIACYDHDIAYKTHKDIFGEPLTRKEADLKVKWAIQHESFLGLYSPMAQWRWLGVRLFGRGSWA